jgi:excisionase family DNA binding protein
MTKAVGRSVLGALGTQTPAPRLALRPLEAADALGVDRTTLYRWARDGRIRFARIAGTTLVPMTEIDRILAAPQPTSQPMPQHATD